MAANNLLSEEQWEILWFVNSIMNYKISVDNEQKAMEIDAIRKTQLEETKEINRKLDLIIKHLEIVDKN